MPPLNLRLGLFIALVLDLVLALPTQIVFNAQLSKPRKLHGRFLHITDIHPDPHYKPHSSQQTACHRKKPQKASDEALYFGTPYAECDSPLVLTNYTFDFLEQHWADEIDFVIWTGDNARHDNDRELPRTPNEIYDLNRAVAAKMQDVFSSRGIPVVPSLGNNDIWPHNILTSGPNSITNEYALIWSSFIPFPYLQVFQRGAYFAVEVIPNEVAVISLNTLYFYDSNKVVSGCQFKDRNDPGNLELDWLEVQLKEFRNRGVQYVRYVELALRFQDTILGHLSGHMNIDHFFFLEAIDLEIVPDKKESKAQAKSLYQTLLQEFSALPKGEKESEFDNYAVANVAPAVVPNPYIPGFRIFSYNISEAEEPVRTRKDREHGHRRGDVKDKSTYCKLPKYSDSWKCHLNEPWHSDANSPSRKNQRLTPLGYAQYYMPTLGDGNATHAPQYELEYMTYAAEQLHPDGASGAEGKFVYPIPLDELPEELRSAGASKSKYTPYGMEDLSIGSWIRLGHRVGNGKHKKLADKFRELMFLGGRET